MKNLQNFGVQELNAKEVKETNGGAIPPWLWQGVAVVFIYNVFADWDENLKAFSAGREDLLGPTPSGSSGSW